MKETIEPMQKLFHIKYSKKKWYVFDLYNFTKEGLFSVFYNRKDADSYIAKHLEGVTNEGAELHIQSFREGQL